MEGLTINACGRDVPSITPWGRRRHTLNATPPHQLRPVVSPGELPKTCEVFRIPLQRCDNEVLQAMSRCCGR
ncbi:hypothetical protein NZK33_15100 [Cyanobium sp. FGCU-6]|nr:hypothetical protein [Cyanobium sp. FGCU6]